MGGGQERESCTPARMLHYMFKRLPAAASAQLAGIEKLEAASALKAAHPGPPGYDGCRPG